MANPFRGLRRIFRKLPIFRPLGDDVRLHVALDSLSERIAIFDRELRFLDVFGQLADPGIPVPSRCLGRTIADVYPDEIARIHTESANWALAGRPVTYDWNIAVGGSEGRWIRTTFSPIKNAPADGPVLVALSRDVTEIKRAELALRNSELQFTAIFHASPVSTVLSSLSTGTIMDVNDAFLQLTGYTRAEVIGLRASDLGLWADPSVKAKLGHGLRELGHLDYLDSKIKTKTGEIKDTLSSLTLVERGGESFILRMDYDITERKHYEDALKASEEKFRSLVESLHDTVVVLDRDLRQVEVLGSSPRMPLTDAAAMRGKRPTESAGPEAGRIHEEKALEAFAGKAVSYEWTWKHPTGQVVWYRTNLSPMFDANGSVARLVSISHDVTDLMSLA